LRAGLAVAVISIPCATRWEIKSDGRYWFFYLYPMAKKQRKSMAELTAGYKDFMKGKEANPDGANAFEKAIKKASTPKKKSRGSK